MLANPRLGKPYLDKEVSFKSRNHQMSLQMSSIVDLNIYYFLRYSKIFHQKKVLSWLEKNFIREFDY